jgi:hypothetical protein
MYTKIYHSELRLAIKILDGRIPARDPRAITVIEILDPRSAIKILDPARDTRGRTVESSLHARTRDLYHHG